MPDARRLGFDVSTDLVPLSRRDFGLLNQETYRLEEVPVYGISWSPQRLADPLAIPSSVYLFACAKSSILSRLPRWEKGEILVKIGCASDVDARLASFNDHPLAKIAGLKFTKVAARHVGVDRAFEEEADLLAHVALIGRPAAETKTEFFFLPELGYRIIEARVAGVLNVA